MFGLAYRLLGSAEEAEDAVRDAYLRRSRADRVVIDLPGARLTTVFTNFCPNRITSARVQREQYGPWLPEPVFTQDGSLGPMELAEQHDSVSTARCWCCPGKAYRGFRAGGHLTPERAVGKVTFERFLAGRFPARG
ncbi:ECF RNA polymerase sigma factor SigJ [Streptomyces sp. Go-475]|nr:ECF RNA polymerase sigma factor SigJ [Streptomyces sp. Go-475]